MFLLTLALTITVWNAACLLLVGAAVAVLQATRWWSTDDGRPGPVTVMVRERRTAAPAASRDPSR